MDFSDERSAPDFIAVDFTSMFGFPQLGGLIVRKRAGHLLQKRRYFGASTVDAVISLDATWHAKKESSLHDKLEDGGPPLSLVLALDGAMKVHGKLFGSMGQISSYTTYLGKQMYDRLASITHYNRVPVCRIYRDPNSNYGDAKTQGPTIAFNVQRSDMSPVGYQDVEKLAASRGISIRSGDCNNPGGLAHLLGWTGEDLKAAHNERGHRAERPRQIIDDKWTGVVRVSLGAMSTIEDVEALLKFIREYYAEREDGSVEAGPQLLMYSRGEVEGPKKSVGVALLELAPKGLGRSLSKAFRPKRSPEIPN